MTREELKKLRDEMGQQEINTLAALHQIKGAIALLDHLLSKMPEDALTIPQVETLLGAKLDENDLNKLN